MDKIPLGRLFLLHLCQKRIKLFALERLFLEERGGNEVQLLATRHQDGLNPLILLIDNSADSPSICWAVYSL